MKTRLKIYFITALLVAQFLFVACSGNKTAGASNNSDSIDYKSYIVQLSYDDPDKALAVIDSLEMIKKYPTCLANFYRCVVHNNSNSHNNRFIINYGKLAISDARFKKEYREFYMKGAYLVACAEFNTNHISESLKLVKEVQYMSIIDGNEEMLIRSLSLIGENLISLGDFDNGIKKYKESVEKSKIFLNANPTEKSFCMTIDNYLSIIHFLDYMERYTEMEKYIAELLAILEKGKTIKFISELNYDSCLFNVYNKLYFIYDYIGKTDKAEHFWNLSAATQTSKKPENRTIYIAYNIDHNNYKQAWTEIENIKKFYVNNKDTVNTLYYSQVIWNELQFHKATGNYKMACDAAERVIVCKDSISRRTELEDAAELAKIYETQEKEKQIAEQEAKLTKQMYILIGVILLLVIGVAFIVIVLRFSRRVNRRNKTIVATINQMMQKEERLTQMQLTDDSNAAENIDPEEIRLKQSLEMLKDDKPIDEIVTGCGYRDANDFGKKFYDHFGIHVEEYCKWTKKMSEQEKTGIKEANQMKQSFIRNMSHEIRTPLNQIYGFVQLLTTPGIQLSDEEKQNFTGIIGEQTSHMTQMLNTFLEISQYESSSEPLPVDTVDISELLTMSCSSFQNIKEGVELTVKNNSGLETLECNQKGLLRILHCIIDNAVKFTDKGQVSVECASNADGNIVFTVTDTGKGIPEGDEERIFEQFYKVDEFIPGTGLGLSLARVIANRMGATIAVDRSYKAQGSRLNITLNK